MKCKRVCAVYFSPAGGTKTVTSHLAAKIATTLNLPLTSIDFTLPAAREERQCFAADDLVVFGVPTYAGRIPNKALPFVQELFAGNGTPAIAVVTFGNRNFDSSLTELVQELGKNGFRVFAASAWACRHVFSQEIIAPGRPDAEDFAKMDAFAEECAARVEASGELDGACSGGGSSAAACEASRAASCVASELAGACSGGGSNLGSRTEFSWKPPVVRGGEPVAPYYVPKGVDGQPAKFLKAKPLTDPEKCTNCGICAKVCPMGSISFEDFSAVPGICIKCQACVLKCPEGAKYFDDAAFLSHVKMLEQNFTSRSEPECYWGEI